MVLCSPSASRVGLPAVPHSHLWHPQHALALSTPYPSEFVIRHTLVVTIKGSCILPKAAQFYKVSLSILLALSPPFSKLGAKVPISALCIFELVEETVQREVIRVKMQVLRAWDESWLCHLTCVSLE